MARRERRRTLAETNAVGSVHTREAEADDEDDDADDDDEGDEEAPPTDDETGVRKLGESTSIDFRLNGEDSCSAPSSL